MWLLPALVQGEFAWRLPLTDGSASRIASILIEDHGRDVVSLDTFEKVLRGDPALTLWSLCKAERWRECPPADWNQLVEWFLNRGLSDLQRLSADAPSPDHELRSSPACASLAARFNTQIHGAPSADVAMTIRCLIGNAAEWLSSYGPSISLDRLLAETTWFPHWLSPCVSVETDNAECPVQTESTRDSGTVQDSLVRCFPAVVRGFLRLRDLETKFDAVVQREKLESLRQLAYGASHEINNPLANIATRAQALLRDERDPEKRRRLATIVNQSFRAHEMISDLMLFAKPPPFMPTDFSISQLARETIGEVAGDAAQQEVTIVLDCDQDMHICADRTQLGVAIKALLRNALEAIGQHGEVHLKISPRSEEGLVSIEVSDTGPGIQPEFFRHLFDPFFSGREAGRGLGFGLSKCWRIAAEHGGQIEAANQPEGGASFTLSIPATSHEKTSERLDPEHKAVPAQNLKSSVYRAS